MLILFPPYEGDPAFFRKGEGATAWLFIADGWKPIAGGKTEALVERIRAEGRFDEVVARARAMVGVERCAA